MQTGHGHRLTEQTGQCPTLFQSDRRGS